MRAYKDLLRAYARCRRRDARDGRRAQDTLRGQRQRQERRIEGDHLYSGVDVPVFLFDISPKGEKIDLTQDEKHTLRKILRHIADGYRGIL